MSFQVISDLPLRHSIQLTLIYLYRMSHPLTNAGKVTDPQGWIQPEGSISQSSTKGSLLASPLPFCLTRRRPEIEGTKGSAFPGEFLFSEKVTIELCVKRSNQDKQGDDTLGDKSFRAVGPPMKKHRYEAECLGNCQSKWNVGCARRKKARKEVRSRDRGQIWETF